MLYGKSKGKEARLCFGGHVLMENRNGLCAEFTIHNPIEQPGPAMALHQLDEHVQLHQGTSPKTVGAHRGYHQKEFIRVCRDRKIAPHVSCKQSVKLAGLDARTTARAGDRLSLRIRKRVEETFGWMKTVGGLRRSRYPGMERTQAWGHFVAATYNLLRMARLESLQAA